MAPAEAPEAARLRVEVAFSPRPDEVDRVALTLAAGAVVRDALQHSGLVQRHGLQIDACTAGVWGRLAALDQPLRDRDRVELYRPLKVDPKEARRQRYRGQRGR